MDFFNFWGRVLNIRLSSASCRLLDICSLSSSLQVGADCYMMVQVGQFIVQVGHMVVQVGASWCKLVNSLCKLLVNYCIMVFRCPAHYTHLVQSAPYYQIMGILMSIIQYMSHMSLYSLFAVYCSLLLRIGRYLIVFTYITFNFYNG